MSTDTPRTDANIRSEDCGPFGLALSHGEIMHRRAEFARTLERELAGVTLENKLRRDAYEELAKILPEGQKTSPVEQVRKLLVELAEAKAVAKPSAVAEQLAEILKRVGRCYGDPAAYDAAYSAVMDAIARCAKKL